MISSVDACIYRCCPPVKSRKWQVCLSRVGHSLVCATMRWENLATTQHNSVVNVIQIIPTIDSLSFFRTASVVPILVRFSVFFVVFCFLCYLFSLWHSVIKLTSQLLTINISSSYRAVYMTVVTVMVCVHVLVSVAGADIWRRRAEARTESSRRPTTSAAGDETVPLCRTYWTRIALLVLHTLISTAISAFYSFNYSC